MTHPASTPLLKARALAFERQGEPVFEGISFELDGGEVLVVEGTNGSGKTTLLRCLAGVMPPGDGALAWYGQELHRDPDAYKAQLAYLGHKLGLKDDLSCLENLKLALAFHGRLANASARGVLNSVGLEGYEHTEARRLSAGQRKRLALSRLLLCPARLWLLDEPFANLDEEGAVLVQRLLEKHTSQGGGAVLTSHGSLRLAVGRHRRLRLGGRS